MYLEAVRITTAGYCRPLYAYDWPKGFELYNSTAQRSECY